MSTITLPNKEPLYFGQTPKYHLEITAGNLDMADYDFAVRLQRGNNSVVIPKSKMVVNDGEFFFGFDTTELGVGVVQIAIIANIPDNDFDGGIRTEITVDEQFANILPL